jgi:hypothetical protein
MADKYKLQYKPPAIKQAIVKLMARGPFSPVDVMRELMIPIESMNKQPIQRVLYEMEKERDPLQPKVKQQWFDVRGPKCPHCGGPK